MEEEFASAKHGRPKHCAKCDALVCVENCQFCRACQTQNFAYKLVPKMAKNTRLSHDNFHRQRPLSCLAAKMQIDNLAILTFTSELCGRITVYTI